MRRLTANLLAPIPPVFSDHLSMAGTAPDGTHLTVNNRYLVKNGQPWLPVMGEVHYSRIPPEQWRAELQKCKAGGIEVIACYHFWIHHEEVEGEFDFTGCRDVGSFLRLCHELGLWVWMRLGPWAHGECRNGGLPDWLLAKGFPTRKNHPDYLRYVERFWRALKHEVKGSLFQEGGPVVGIQVENELMQDSEHLLTLKKLAHEIGLNPPFTSVTGWGDVHVPEGEALPVFGGYADGFWERSTTEWPLRYRKNFFFRLTRNDTSIGNDLNGLHSVGEPVDPNRYPYLTCETGGDMPSSFHRRIHLDPMDTVALAYVMVGSGSNLQGYYMYHGGTNPHGKRSTLQESQATGYPNDVPAKSYFAGAPLGDFGQVNPAFRPLRRLHQFLRDFGAQLSPMPTVLPDDLPPQLEDQATLRWAVRHDGEAGFLFVNNHQRVEQLPPHQGVQFELRTPGGTLLAPDQPIDVPAGACFVLPFGLRIGSRVLRSATAQPFAILGDGTHVFTEIPGIPARITFEDESEPLVLGEARWVRQPEVILLSAAVTEHASVIAGRFLLSPAVLIEAGDAIGLLAERAEDLWCEDPVLSERWECPQTPEPEPELRWQTVRTFSEVPELRIGQFEVVEVPSAGAYEFGTWVDVELGNLGSAWRSHGWLEVNYVGSIAQVEVDGEIVTDHFWNGEPWKIGLNLLPASFSGRLRIKLLPILSQDPLYLESGAWGQLTEDPQAQIHTITLARYYYGEVKL